MLLSELRNSNPAIQNLTKRINFVVYPQETEIISKKLQSQGIDPTMSNIKNYLIRWLTVPIDEVPKLERLIILRSGRPERFE